MPFIEVTSKRGTKRFVNIVHIAEVFENNIYLDDTPPTQIVCSESYEEIVAKIKKAVSDDAEIY